ncbi:uncharacterized protein K444DRAFT_624243 [Hyaloscypha bicolor E]|uniref:Uncharacterized protein n=1 Tax=Hyaloscypha bicolor E TaxID=1095630 RepID=A0A2J6TUR7_9HELO|nr:uncharacterized protein K444DRAFT_624243 [Hyaloscypha bicolor E]PMD66760.1 hypothetical protein K444DRAFT_624243 [Hyaloscypha bicolor E]
MQAILEDLADVEIEQHQRKPRQYCFYSVPPATAQSAESSIEDVARGTKRGSDGARHLRARQETGNSEMTDPSPTNPPHPPPHKRQETGQRDDWFIPTNPRRE